jgi:hypothetical protein
LAPRSVISYRLATAPIAVRRSLLALLVALCLASSLSPPVKLRLASSAQVEAGQTDAGLFKRVIARVDDGEPYYRAAATEYRAADYPLKPFVAVRLPTHAWLAALLGNGGLFAALVVVAAAALLAWAKRLSTEPGGGHRGLFALVTIGTIFVSLRSAAPFTESWAAVLITMSLALRTDTRYRGAVAAGLAAALFRELAIPYLVLMLVAATIGRRRNEAIAWLGALVASGVTLLLHARAVADVVLPGDLRSQGWSGFGGWPMFTTAARFASPLALFPGGVARFLLPLALVGWAAWRSPLAVRVAGMLVGYAAMILLFARIDNAYWSLFLTPTLLGGLALVPGLMRSWWRVAGGGTVSGERAGTGSETGSPEASPN